MNFKGISRTFSTINNEQYNTIETFWDELSEQYGLENLQGLGYNWTETTIEYVIGLRNGEIDGSNVCISLPDNSWQRVQGKIKDIKRIYDEIYKYGSLKYEIERFDNDGNCTIYFQRSPDFVKPF